MATNPFYEEQLRARREEHHNTHLTFVAVGYERQRREGRVGMVEHPWSSRAWKTKAFNQMQGFDTYIDMCQYGLMLPNDEGEVLPVKKPTCLRVTSPVLHAALTRSCPGTHWHTPLEGYASGWGQRSVLAENFTQKFATQVIAAILQELSPEFQENVYAVEELEDAYNAEAAVERGEDARTESDPVKLNRQLKTEVGARAVDYVKRLHRNLGHCSAEVLERMLREVQASQDVLTAARRYVCELCYARKPPKQVPPASGLTCTAFNDRIQADSHWIQCEESVVKIREPMPGTPAAKKKEKKRKEKEPLGRQCVLTIVDHATRFCAIRILKSEKAEEFTKGLERAWVKHFGIPKLLRVDEAKGWASKHVREWASSRGITIEVQPAEAHSWLGVVERKHQVIRRALELYQDAVGKHDKETLKEAAIYVPHAVNQLSFHKGFSPQQWVLGKSTTYVHGLSSEIFNPGQEALDEQGVFADVQRRRAEAARAFISADSDAKLRRAFTQKFREQKEELVVGQQCWYWRNAGAGILRKARWRGPARVVAIEEVKDTQVLWLCHGTALIRCAPHQVRPLVEEMGTFVPTDRHAAMRDLEELKARSTTQYRDEVRRSGVNLDAEYPDDDELDAEYVPGTPPADYDPLDDPDDDDGPLPGVVSMLLPQQSGEERERTPRRRASNAPTAEPPESIVSEEVTSPKRKTADASVDADAATSKVARTEERATSSTEARDVPVPIPADDELQIEDIFVVSGEGTLPEGWKCVEGSLELDEIYLQGARKGEVIYKDLNVDEKAEFVNAKKAELDSFFSNAVWEFADEQDTQEAAKAKRMVTARWVLTWKRINENELNAPPKYKAKARLVLRGFEDPDLLTMKTAAPTASRMSRMYLIAFASWKGWVILCGDVKTAFLSGSPFDRVLIVRLPKDCNPILGWEKAGLGGHTHMRMKKSAYGLADAPLLWYKEASSRLRQGGWKQHPLDQCCFMLVVTDKVRPDGTLVGLLIIHVDDVLITGDDNSPVYKQAIITMKKNFNFGKWDELSKDTPLKYCGGTITQTDYGMEISYKEYMDKICPVTIQKGRKPEDEMSSSEVSKARAIVGALQWPASQGMPMLSASVSIQAGTVMKGKVKDLMELNKTLRFGKSQSGATLKFLAKPPNDSKQRSLEDMVLVCYADAAFCVREDKSSQGGFIVLAAHKSVLEGQKCPASVISWRSFKLPRVCRSSLAAECQATSTALEELLMAKTFLEAMKRPNCNLAVLKDDLRGESAMVTDCKALYDAVHRETIQQATDKRVAIEGLVIKDCLKDLKCRWRWVSSERQLADGLTKVHARTSFVERYQGCFVQLVADLDYVAAKKKTQEERRKTVQETRSGGRSAVATTLIGLVMNSEVTTAEAESPDSDDGGVLTWWLTMWLGVISVLCYLGHYVMFVRPYRWRITSAPTLQESILALTEEKTRLQDLWGEALKKVHLLERRVAQKDQKIRELTAELRRARGHGHDRSTAA